MTKEKLDKANELANINKTIEKIETVLYEPHPYLTGNRIDVCFINLGKSIEKELKDTMFQFLKKKKEEINKEFKEL